MSVSRLKAIGIALALTSGALAGAASTAAAATESVCVCRGMLLVRRIRLRFCRRCLDDNFRLFGWPPVKPDI